MKQERRIGIVRLTAQAGCVLGLLLAAGCPGDDGDTADTDTGPAPTTGGADDGTVTEGGTPTTMPPGDDDGMPQTSSTGPGVEDDTTAGPIDTGSTGEPPEVPAGWTCDDRLYADGACDCGCGAVDSDCADATAASCEYCESCSPIVEDCAMVVDAADNSVCGTGRCGNGMPEGGEACDGTEGLPPGLDCMGLGFESGEVACNADCTNVDLTMCMGGPEGWTCLPEYFGTDDGCDCGCGVVDPDCADMTMGSCEYCDNLGSCVAFNGDCTAIDPENNAACQ